MEADPGKQRSRQKRRERALQLQQEKQTTEEDEASGQDDQDVSSSRSNKDKLTRTKPKKIKSALFEEDIIDGFAIMSFKTLEELENVSKKNGCFKIQCVKDQVDNADSLSHDGLKVKKKKLKKSTSVNSCSENSTSNGDVSDGHSGNGGSNSTSLIGCESVDQPSNHHNGEPPRSISRDRLSDASTHSGSGQGYVCDVESGDDKASESGSDVFSGLSSTRLINHLPSNGHTNPCVALTAPTPPPSTSTTPTSLYNGSLKLSSSPVHELVVASTTSSTAGTTTDPSVDLVVSPLVSSCTLPSVIHSTSCIASPQLLIDTSSCARSLQYSKSLKASSYSHHTSQPSHTLFQNGSNKPAVHNHFPFPPGDSGLTGGYPAFLHTDTCPRTDPGCSSAGTVPVSNPALSLAGCQPPQHLVKASNSLPPFYAKSWSPVSSTSTRTPVAIIEPCSQPQKGTVDNILGCKDKNDKPRVKDSAGPLSHIHQAKDAQKPPVSVNSSLPSSFPAPKPVWSNTTAPLYSPLHHNHPHTSPIHPLSSPNLPPSSTFPLPLPLPPPLLAAGAPNLPSTSNLSTAMFAAPPAPPTNPLTTHPSPSNQFIAESLLRNQDFLHQDLNNRLLAHRDSSSLALPSPLPSSQFIRNETHQHQHQHLHNHMHQHTYGSLTAVPPNPPLYDKMHKVFDSSVYRSSLVPSYAAAFSSLLPSSSTPSSSSSSAAAAATNLGAALQGTFQPKKQGKWCAVHVRVAWEIHHRQQKQSTEPLSGSSSKLSSDSKPLEPSHMLSSSRTSELGPASLLASVPRSVPDGIVHPTSSFLSSANLVPTLSNFPRPAPYPSSQSLINPLGFSGLGSSMFAPVRDIGPSSQTDWSRTHRPPATSYATWTKSELDREKDREKDRDRDLRKEEDKERDRRSLLSHKHEDSHSRHKDLESSRPKSRSRSRSPLRNGHNHHKSDLSHYDRSSSSSLSMTSSMVKPKDELMSHHLVERDKLERERLERERLDRMERERLERERMEKEKFHSEREKMLHAAEQRDKYFQGAGFIGVPSFPPGLHGHAGLLDRRMGLMAPPVGYPFLDRGHMPAGMWGNPFDKVELAHRVELERERERLAIMSRLNLPSQLAVMEQQERLKDHFLRDQQEREFELRRQYFDRLPAFSADRLRTADPMVLSGYFPRTISPMFASGALVGLKSNSPHLPASLIPPSSSTTASMLSSRSHDNSPSSSSKSKGCSPADSTSDLKDKGSSTDPDAHSR